MKLNEDYTKLKEQIEYIENNMLNCKDAKTAAAYLGTYETLTLCFYLMTGENPCNKKVNRNRSIGIMGQEKNNEIRNKAINNLVKNRNNHFNLLFSFSSSAVDIIDDVMESEYY